jgi:hypothetical protein
MSQYINYAVSNVTGEPMDCIQSKQCDGIMCHAGFYNSTLTVSVNHCSIPPSLDVVMTSPNGSVFFNRSIADFEILSWDVLASVLQLNITVLHPSSTHIGLQVMGSE